jgi:hypothetical protein
MNKRSKTRQTVFSAPENIEPFEGRPNRETCISEDDVSNLIIALNTSVTLNEFLLTV